MKILKVEFENINSLKGNWVIDFTDPSYEENHNLFVVCGDTGTGKTSILDAITLALYGRTPRQGLVYNSKDGNEVMTRDTGNCYARVTYKCMKGTFVTEWNQRRARDKADGNLQNSEGLVYRLEDRDNPIFKGRTGKDGELGIANARNIQLDYSQFCRSIMLAQGEFSEFLSCDEDKRAAILEKLNGSEKYRKIAIKSGEHWSAANAALGKAESAYNAVAEGMLTPEQIAEKTAESDRLQGELNALASSLDEIGELVKWYESLKKNKIALDSAEDAFKDADQKKKYFAPKANLLANGLRAVNCKASFLRVEGLEKSKVAKEGELRNLQSQLDALNAEIKNAETIAREKEAALETAEAFVRDNSELWRMVRQLDSDVKNAQEKVFAVEGNVKTIADEVSSKEAEEQKYAEDVSGLTERIGKGEIFLKEHAEDSGIASVLSGFKAQIEVARGQEHKIAIAAHDVDECAKEVANLNASCEKQRKDMEANETYLQEHVADINLPQVIAESRVQVDQLISAHKDVQTQTGIVQDCESKRAEFEKKLEEASRTVECIKQQQLDLFNNEVIVLADVIQKHLVEGEACPVCGSKEHPSCCGSCDATKQEASDDTNVSDVASKIRALNEKLTDARENLNAVERDSNLNCSALETAAASMKKSSGLYEEMLNKLTSAWSPWGKTVEVSTCQKVLEELQKAGDDYAFKANANASAVENLRKTESQLAIEKSSLEEKQKLYNSLQEELADLAGTMEKSVSDWISNFRPEDLESIYTTLENRSTVFEKAQAGFKDLQGRLETAKNNQANAIQNKTEAQTRLTDASQELNTAKEALSAVKTARIEKFGEKDVDTVEKQANQQVESARKGSTDATNLLTERQNKASGFKSQIEQRNTDIAKDSAELETARQDFSADLIKNSFASVDEYKAACQSDEQIAEWQSLQTKVNEGFIAAEQSVKDARKLYNDCLAEHSDVEKEEVLRQKQTEMKARQLELQNQCAVIVGALNANTVQSSNLANLKADLDKAQAEMNRWETMRSWFGVKDGSDFSTFVQGLTFKSLLKLANRQLHEMKGRYTLIPKGNLSFEIEDTHFDKPRSISNLSGGEKFLVSLSLALGIAEFASRNVRIESLFMDEGFGTLDGETLESVMDSLRVQRSKGKMLGIITHVDSVIESIDQRIRLSASHDGHSVISGPGVSRGEALSGD